MMLDETRLHWKLINFGVLLRSFLGGEGFVQFRSNEILLSSSSSGCSFGCWKFLGFGS